MTHDELEEKLTAYAVGEASEAVRAEIEALLAADESVRCRLAALREDLSLIAAAEAGGPERLAETRREAVLSKIVTGPAGPRMAPRWISIASMVAASALTCFALWESRDPRPEEGGAGRSAPTSEQRPVSRELEIFTDHLVGGNELAGYLDLRVRSTYPVGTNFPNTPNMRDPGNLFRSSVIRTKVPIRDFDIQIAQDAAIADPILESEQYASLVDNPFFSPTRDPLSTFSIDVDTAAYANVRRFLNAGQLPPPDAVRGEELINYFHYDYRPPAGMEPFSVELEVHAAPWEPKHRLVRIGVQGREIEMREAPAANLVFLVDVSGSMNSEDKLPLVQKSLRLLVEGLRAQDRVALVVYAGNAGLVLPPTGGTDQKTILAAIDALSAGGSTNGGEGIELAYRLAAQNFVQGGINRVLLCTDGDFNVGVSSEGDLVRLIEEKRKSGVFLSVLGFGTGNLADARMQQLADKGNGNASYIDSLGEARKVLVEQATGTLITIAKDVKIQVEFNPAKVAAYRLIGYETRLLAAQDFNDDRKDAGEIGAGHQVTALYEIVPAGADVPAAAPADPLKYQKPADATPGAALDELLTVKLRSKAPDGDVSVKTEFTLADPGVNTPPASDDFEFASAVAAFGMCLRNSEYRGGANLGLVRELALAGIGDDPKGYRKEFVELVKKAEGLAKK